MFTPDVSRNCKVSKELHQDLTRCLEEFNKIAPGFLVHSAERISNKLVQVQNGGNPIDLRLATRELRLSTGLIEAIRLSSEILSGKVISNEVERKSGETSIGDLVTSLRSLAQDSDLCTIASKITTELGEIEDRSLGTFLRVHAQELAQLSIDRSLEPLIIPQPPAMNDSDFG